MSTSVTEGLPYYCSFMGATDPNRYHMWTGWVGNDGRGGGPVLDNAEAGYEWPTFPERLQAAGVSWKIYQDVGDGLDAAHHWGWGNNASVGNYGDNSLLYFRRYQKAAPGSALFERARTGTDVSQGGTLFDDFEREARTGRLPQVSWIVAPEAYTEHPNWPSNYGAWYVSKILDALTSNPDVWSKTVFFLTYDENDGFFDHMVPPTPPQSRAEGLSSIDAGDEIFEGNEAYAPGPYGLGVRVPMIVMSPWSRGGWVNSQVFDHTSLIRFIERRFGPHYPGLTETNITKWRRAVAGDLTSAFDFRSPETSSRTLSLPSTLSCAPSDFQRHPDYVPNVPATVRLPKQERGLRPARALPYELDVRADIDMSHRRVVLQFINSGKAAAVFHVRSAKGQGGPWTYTVGTGARIEDAWTFFDGTSYDLMIYGPNGFMRRFADRLVQDALGQLSVQAKYQTEDRLGLNLHIENQGSMARSVTLWDAYARTATSQPLGAWQRIELDFELDGSFGWYDLTIELAEAPGLCIQLAGHIENGRDSASDPAMGTPNQA